MKVWSETGRQEVAKLKWLQGRKKNWDAVDGAEKMPQIDRKKKNRLESQGTDVPLCHSRISLLRHLITTSHIFKY